MPKCVSCGKKGMFLKVDRYTKLCDECAERERVRKKKEQTACNLVVEADDLIKSIMHIDGPQGLEKFITGYDNAVLMLKKAADIQKNTRFVKYTDNIQELYEGLVEEKQWHIRDAIEALYKEIR